MAAGLFGPTKPIEVSRQEAGHSLRPTLSWPHLVALGVGAIVGTGIYTLTGVGAFNRAFHRALFRPCGKPITVNILERLQVLSERYVRMHLEPLGRDERANEEHRELLQAWLARDTGRVADLVHAHIGKTIEDLHLQLVEE